MDKSFQIGQMRRYSELTGYHKHVFIVANRRAKAMGTTEQYQARIRGAAFPISLGVTQKFSGQASAGLHEELQGVLPPIRPGCYHERMALQKGPETDRGNPEVDILSGFDLERFRKTDPNFDRAMGVGDESSRAAVAEGPVPIQHTPGLEQQRCQEHGSGDVEVKAREDSVGW